MAPRMTLRPHFPQRCLAPSTACTAAWSRAWLTHSAPGCLPWLTCGGGCTGGGRGEQWGVRAMKEATRASAYRKV